MIGPKVKSPELTNALEMAYRQLSPKHKEPTTPEGVLDFAMTVAEIDEKDIISYRATLMAAADEMVQELGLPDEAVSELFDGHLDDYRAEKMILVSVYNAARTPSHEPIISLHNLRVAAQSRLFSLDSTPLGG